MVARKIIIPLVALFLIAAFASIFLSSGASLVATQAILPDIAGAVFAARDVDENTAEQLFAAAPAALYLPDRRYAQWMEDNKQTHIRPLAKAVLVPASNLQDFFAEAAREFPMILAQPGERYLLKLPAKAQGSFPQSPMPILNPPALSREMTITESFESGLGAWDLANNTSDKFNWGITSCAARSGQRAADAVRGGAGGSQLSCSAVYPPNVVTSMIRKDCEGIRGAAQAWLDLHLLAAMNSTADSVGFYYLNDRGEGYGYIFTGNWDAWTHLVFNLKQWFTIGDVTAMNCPSLLIQFKSGGTAGSGFGARIDDVTVGTETPSFLRCSINASPVSGRAPLTVNFAADAPGSTGTESYNWTFGDAAGSSASTRNTVFTYNTPGDYLPRLRIIDAAGGRAYAHTRIYVDQPAPPGLPGDCDNDGVITVMDIQRAVNMFLGREPIACGVDINGDGRVTADEIQRMIYLFLNPPGTTTTVAGSTSTTSIKPPTTVATTTTSTAKTSTSTLSSTTVTSTTTTTTLSGGDWSYGAAKSYAAPPEKGSSIQDDISGFTFRFPDGGNGRLTITRITSGPNIAPQDVAFQVAYTGDSRVQLALPDPGDDRTILCGYASSDLILALGENAGVTDWYAMRGSLTIDWKVFDLPLPGISLPGMLPDRKEQSWPGISRFKSVNPNDDILLDKGLSLKLGEAKEEIRKVIPTARITAMNAVLDGKLTGPSIYFDPRAKESKPWYQAFYYNVKYLPMRIIRLDAFCNYGNLAHEFGHYFHHALVGDDAYFKFAWNPRPPHNHGVGEPGALKNLIEEPAFFTELYLIGRIGTGVRLNWNPSTQAVRRIPDRDPSLRCEDLEGFGASMFASLVRANESEDFRNFRNKMVKVPIIQMTDRLEAFRDIYEIIAQGLTDIHSARRSLENVLASKYKQAEKLPVILEALGWSYQVRCRFVDKDKKPLANIAASVVKTANGVSYTTGDGVSETDTEYPFTRDDGKYLFRQCFGGTGNTLRIVAPTKTDQVIIPTKTIDIPWETPSNQIVELGDVEVIIPEPPLPPPPREVPVSFAVFRRLDGQRQYCQNFTITFYRGGTYVHSGKSYYQNGLHETTFLEDQGYSYAVDATYTMPPETRRIYGSFIVIPNRTNAFNVETSISATSVGLYPVTATVHPNGKKTYYATVSSLAENSDVDWSVDEKIGGTIVKQANGTGIYTAPSNDGIFHVRATSKADASAYARALVYVTSVVSVSISPQSITMPTDGQCTFLATVVGTGNQELEWSTTGGKVTPAAGGKATYQAPMDPGTYEVTATSIADRTKMATATVTVAASGPKTLNFGGKVVTQLSPGIPINVTLIAEGTVIAPTGIGNNGELIEPKFSEGSAKSLGGLLQTPCKGTNKSATVSGSLSCALASTTYRNNGEPSDANYRVSNLSVRYEKCRTVGELPSGSHNFECTASAGLNATLYCGWSVWVQALVDVEEATYSKSNNREISRRKFTIPIPQGAGITIDPY